MITSNIVYVVWSDIMLYHSSPSSIVFISMEIVVSELLVYFLNFTSHYGQFWHKWRNSFDVMAFGTSLIRVKYFNEERVLRELEEVAVDSVMGMRNATQYVRLAIFSSRSLFLVTDSCLVAHSKFFLRNLPNLVLACQSFRFHALVSSTSLPAGQVSLLHIASPDIPVSYDPKESNHQTTQLLKPELTLKALRGGKWKSITPIN
ncbi:hypothetical protein PsorP6_018591 [Peronosclerospora sorghi]|nr:hypothetical protein PsorP6_018591 [Peronosclerospora sorghi]